MARGTGHLAENLHGASPAGGRFRNGSPNTRFNPTPALEYVGERKRRNRDLPLKPHTEWISNVGFQSSHDRPNSDSSGQMTSLCICMVSSKEVIKKGLQLRVRKLETESQSCPLVVWCQANHWAQHPCLSHGHNNTLFTNLFLGHQTPSLPLHFFGWRWALRREAEAQRSRPFSRVPCPPPPRGLCTWYRKEILPWSIVLLSWWAQPFLGSRTLTCKEGILRLIWKEVKLFSENNSKVTTSH